MSHPIPSLTRAEYPHSLIIPTRWMDNDIYGHVNNVVYYSWFDTAINHYLITVGELDIHTGAIIGLCVESGCRYHQPIAFPDQIAVGLRVAHLGSSSVRYEIGLFRNDETDSAADGFFVHIFVDRKTRRPHPILEPIRRSLTQLQA